MKSRIIGCIVFVSATVYAIETPIGIVGGGDSFGAAWVYSDGSSSEITGFPNLPTVHSVSLNANGGLLGGSFPALSGGGISSYAAFVNFDGSLKVLSTPLSGNILSVALNHSGKGVIGGSISIHSGDQRYAAVVSPNGEVTPCSFSSNDGKIYSVAINPNGVGIIGGRVFLDHVVANPYAAFVSSNGDLSSVDLSGFQGEVVSVAMNREGTGLIGGNFWINSPIQNIPYVAFVSPSGSLTRLPLSENDEIKSVALNDAGLGLIGGKTSSSNCYAAFVSSDGSVSSVAFPPSSEGTITTVAMNQTGSGIIGGQLLDISTMSYSAYAALVGHDGTLIRCSGGNLPSSGNILSVAINDAGVGLIGGNNDLGSFQYAALVAPSGVLTDISFQGFSSLLGQIESVDFLRSNDVLNLVTPQSSGSGMSVVNGMLSAANVLSSQTTATGNLLPSSSQPTQNISLLADARDTIQNITYDLNCPFGKAPQYTIWFSPFGNYVTQKSEGRIPSVDNQIGGALAGFNYSASNFLVGGAIGYAFNYIHYGSKAGHSKIQQEMASLYGTFNQKHFWINAALWGGIYQLNSTRHTLVFINSKGSTDGWMLSPHLEMATPWEIGGKCRYWIEPFAMFDWVNHWQDGFTEKGASGLNLVIKDQYSSLLRSSLGVRFYEVVRAQFGDILFQEKISYVNLSPFHTGNVTTSFVASSSTFPVAAGSSKVQNLGGLNFLVSFLPKNQAYPYFTIDCEVDLGTSYQSYFGRFEIGKGF